MENSGAAGPSAFPGFDGIRFVAAVCVLFSHAFLIAEGSEDHEPLRYLLGHGNILGLYGVFTFFMISGFLLTNSLASGTGAIQFACNRFLRIIPGFLLCVVATALVVGAMVTPLTLPAYYAQPQTYTYVLSSLVCLCDSWETPFQFATHTNLAGVKNGSLWSLSYEVLSYLFLLWLWVMFRRPLLVATVAGLAALASVVMPHLMPGIAYTLPYFSAGVIMYVVHSRFGTTPYLAALSVGLLGASTLFGLQHYAFAIFGAYIVVFLAQRLSVGSHFIKRCGDLSYGVYLFGWPVEQTIQHFIGLRSGWQLFAISLPTVLACAAASWWVVERPCLKLKKFWPLLTRAPFGLRSSRLPGLDAQHDLRMRSSSTTAV